MQRAIVISRFGGPEVLELQEVAVPEPGPGEARVRSLQALRAGGRVVAYGFHAGTGQLRGPREQARARDDLEQRTRFDALEAGDANVGIFAFNVTTLREQRPDWYQADLAALFGLLERGAIAPPVAGRLALAQATEAHRRLEGADVIGKLVLVPQA